jgi:hypothetical protein
MASSRPWPLDDEDRPSGSVRPLSQADLEAILAHLSDDPDELLAGTSAGRSVVAVRVRASVGRPGGSAHAQWRRARAVEWAAWTRSLSWRAAVTLGAGTAGAVLGGLLAPGSHWSSARWRPWRPAGGCGSDPARTPSRGGGERRGSSVPPACWLGWSGRGGRSCTTWPSPAAAPTWIIW